MFNQSWWKNFVKYIREGNLSKLTCVFADYFIQLTKRKLYTQGIIYTLYENQYDKIDFIYL